MDFDLFYKQSAFARMSRGYVRSLFKDAILVNLLPDEFLFHQGTQGRGLYFLVKGRLQVILEIEQAGDLPKKELVLDCLQPFSCFGEVCFLKEQPRLASIKATESSECLYLDQQILARDLRRKDINAYQFNNNLGQLVAERLAKLDQKLYGFCKNEPQLFDQFARYLQNTPADDHPDQAINKA